MVYRCWIALVVESEVQSGERENAVQEVLVREGGAREVDCQHALDFRFIVADGFARASRPVVHQLQFEEVAFVLLLLTLMRCAIAV